ncbi:hypothetical protein Adt_38648 [Abeliophyllum distichum]|uniref:Uncharacterized protein n=1 Tax=Abeliophyllum distichum TaxID=126358 RepID=A0ABD1Q3U1_9LAMI
MMQSCNLRARRSAVQSKPPKFNAIMIYCSRLISTSEETRDRQSPIVLQHVDHHLMPALPKEHSFAQGPFPLGLDHLAACSSHRATLHTSVSPTGTRAPCSSHGTTLRTSVSPTGTRPPGSLLLP